MELKTEDETNKQNIRTQNLRILELIRRVSSKSAEHEHNPASYRRSGF